MSTPVQRRGKACAHAADLRDGRRADAPDDLAAVLGSLPYFAELEPTARAELARHVRQRSYDKDGQILMEGERSDTLPFVLRGRVKVVKVWADGKEHVLRVVGQGRTFNDVPVFDGGPNPASVVALEPCVVGFIPAAEIVRLIERFPRVAHAVIRLFASRLRSLTQVIEDLSFRTVVARVARLLHDCARGEPTLVEGTEGLCAVLTQQQLAAMTGSVREVVQRALKTLERNGAIRLHRGRVQVVDPAALARWSEAGPPEPAR
jgi:CRP/FNR family transcriptional regulator